MTGFAASLFTYDTIRQKCVFRPRFSALFSSLSMLTLFCLLPGCSPSSQRLENAPCLEHSDCQSPLLCLGLKCAPAIQSQSLKPIARIEGPTSLQVRNKVAFSAKTSQSFAQDTLKYRWTLEVPSGSKAALDSISAVETSLVPDLPGSYVLQLIVADKNGNSQPARLLLQVKDTNRPPVARLTPQNKTLETGKEILLDASGSSDIDGDNLQFDWQLRLKPDNSRLKKPAQTASRLRFVPDVPGPYVMEVIVSDGRGGKRRATSTLTALPVSNRQKPVLRAVSPQKGILGTRMVWSLEGESFAQGCRVFVDGTPINSVLYLSSRQLKITVNLEKSTATSLRLEVENAPGFRSAPLLVALEKAKSPEVWQVTPGTLQTGQKVQLQIRGKSFLEGARVFVEGRQLPTQTLSSTQLQATLQAPKAGTYTLVVQNPDGQRSTPWPLFLSSLQARISRSEVSELGKQCGLQTWSVFGHNFLPGIRAHLEALGSSGTNTPANQLQRLSSTEVRVSFDVSKLAAGQYWLTLTNPGVSRGEKLLFRLRESTPPPLFFHHLPDRLVPGTKAQVFILGRELKQFVLSWQKKPVFLDPVNRSTASLTLDVPAGYKGGLLELRSRCSKQVFTARLDAETFTTPVIQRLEPRKRRLQDKGVTAILGKDFHPKVIVRVDGQKVQSRWVHKHRLELPASLFQRPGEVKIELRNPNGLTGNAVSYTIDHTPVLLRLEPAQIHASSTGVLTLHGDNFASNAQVWLAGKQLTTAKRLSATTITVPLRSFPSPGSYSLRIRNPGTRLLQSLPLSLVYRSAPRLLRSKPLALLADTLPVFVELQGENLRSGGTLTLNGKGIAGVRWNSLTSIEFPSARLPQTGLATLLWQNPGGQSSPTFTLKVWATSSMQLTETRSSGQGNSALTYFCGKGLRQTPNGAVSQLRFWQSGQSRGVQPGTNSFSLLHCVYVQSSTLAYLPSGSYEVEVCREEKGALQCSNRIPWVQLPTTHPLPPSSSLPTLQRIEPLSPQRWDQWTVPPKTLSILLRGTGIERGTKVLWRGQDVAKLPGVKVHAFSGGISVFSIPLPAAWEGSHPVEIQNEVGHSNTIFVQLSRSRKVSLSSVGSLLLHNDLPQTFQFTGAGLQIDLSVFLGGVGLLEGGLPLSWSSFSSRVPFYLESSAWSGASKTSTGSQELALKDGKGNTPASLTVQVLSRGQWGKERPSLQAADDKGGYTPTGGLAPTPGEYVQWRLGVTGVSLQNNQPQIAMYVEDKLQKFVQMEPTNTTGWTQLLLPRQDFLGQPRVLPIGFRNASNTLIYSNFATLMPSNSLRLTRIQDNTLFSSTVSPNKSATLEVHGRKLSSTTEFYLSGHKLTLLSYNKDPGTGAEWVRLKIPILGLPDGQHPLWALQGARASNTLLVRVRRQETHGAVRLKSITPLRISLQAAKANKNRIRFLVKGYGWSDRTTLRLQNKSYNPILLDAATAIFEVDTSQLQKGTVKLVFGEGAGKREAPVVSLKVED